MLRELAFWLTIKPRMMWLQRLLPKVEIYPTGSRYVCDPPVFGTDIDLLVYSEEDIKDALVAYGFVISNHKEYFHSKSQMWEFTTWRKGVINLIVTSSRRFVERHVTATHICKSMNVRNKWDRVVVHEALRDNYEWKPDILDPKVKTLLDNLTGPYGKVLYQTYRIQHGLAHEK